ncbi:hypothetical protein [Phytoactinopolyspora halophila]|uniref:hypothetical protein n=1 Tax=Phytoactinopolyspora halophila TaxID=1981511 RepID=UPI000F4FED22|nr:hypothetical protein [Phytoactinopolyspora halophila]
MQPWIVGGGTVAALLLVLVIVLVSTRHVGLRRSRAEDVESGVLNDAARIVEHANARIRREGLDGRSAAGGDDGRSAAGE